jgi:hypothetical protein
MEEANLPEAIEEAIRIAVVVAFRTEKEARVGDVGTANGARDVEVATEAGGVEVASRTGGVGGAGGNGGVVGIGSTSGASSMRRGRSKSPTSKRKSRCGKSSDHCEGTTQTRGHEVGGPRGVWAVTNQTISVGFSGRRGRAKNTPSVLKSVMYRGEVSFAFRSTVLRWIIRNPPRH